MHKSNILVTGANGFIGKHLVELLKNNHYNVFSMSKSLGHNVCNKNDFNVFTDKNIDAVFHLAAKTFVPESWRDPNSYYSSNVIGTQNVLDFCRATKSKLVYISAYIYGIPNYLPIDENHPVNPNNPYAHSKWIGEELCKFYSKEFDVNVSVIRPFNIYGPGQAEHFLIPSLISQAKTKDMIIVKDDSPKRDYVHVKDFARACIATLEINDGFKIFNVGAGESISIKEIIEIILKDTNKPLSWRSLGEKRMNEIPNTIADCCAIKRETGWYAEKSLSNYIKELLIEI